MLSHQARRKGSEPVCSEDSKKPSQLYYVLLWRRGKDLCVHIRERKNCQLTPAVYSQINKYTLSRVSCLPQSVYPVGPSIAGEVCSGWERLSPSRMPMPASPVPRARTGSLEKGRFESEARKASVLQQGPSCPSSLLLLRPVASPGAREASRSPAGPARRRERAVGEKGTAWLSASSPSRRRLGTLAAALRQ